MQKQIRNNKQTLQKKSKQKKYLNKNNMTLSYSCMTNIETIIRISQKKKLIDNNRITKMNHVIAE